MIIRIRFTDKSVVKFNNQSYFIDGCFIKIIVDKDETYIYPATVIEEMLVKI